jgi:hypothetical protein
MMTNQPCNPSPVEEYPELVSLPPILDFEASSLSDESYPISAGLLVDGKLFYWLIKPEYDWTDWDFASQRVHGIPEYLIRRDGLDANQVYREICQLLAGHDAVYSDAPIWEYKWFKRLGTPPCQVKDLHALIPTEVFYRLGETKAHFIEAHQLTAHRADHDALILGLCIHTLQKHLG